MYLNIHIIFSFAAGNPNRDDSGAPKTLVYGGCTRSRISSQAMTRPKRVAYETDPAGEASVRSGDELIERIAGEALARITESGVAVDQALTDRVSAAVQGAVTKLYASKAAESADEETQGDHPGRAAPKETMVWLAEAEIQDAVAATVAKHSDGALSPEDFIPSGHKTHSLTIAAFGRMFANRPELQTEAAVQRSHAFTTHPTDVDVDYFTTVNDLEKGSGAGFLSVAQFTGGVYYWHANLDTRQLAESWLDLDAPEAHARLEAFFNALFTALPGGRMNTTAASGLPALVLAVPATTPASLQTAYERPVTSTDGYLGLSIQRLADTHRRTVATSPSRFPGPPAVAGVNVDGFPESVAEQMNLDQLAAWCAEQVLAAEGK